MAVLLITHDLGVVCEAADRVIVMYCGQIVEQADVKSLFNNPLHPYTVGLMKSIPRLDDNGEERLFMIPGMVPNPLNMPSGCPFSDRCGKCMERCKKADVYKRQVNDTVFVQRTISTSVNTKLHDCIKIIGQIHYC